MAFHFIAITGDYVRGHRIGWHYASDKKLDKEYIEDFMTMIKKRCGDVQLGIHKLSTPSTDWKSVVEKDSFFSDVAITHDEEYFIQQLLSGKELRAFDVAKFILSVFPMTHLKLQKLLYYVYAEYLLETGRKLFRDPIVAFKYGPVVEDVFYKFKHNGRTPIDYKEDEVFSIHAAKVTATPSLVRIISAEYGLEIAKSIITSLETYVSFDATELVEMTHTKGGPWDCVYQPGRNSTITDDVIKDYHHVVKKPEFAEISFASN